ncbi:MAG: bifunctional phosphoglucose/phosphomannose isomerase [Chloroflexota bacterium]|nr:bifunctional phosphoglucose/phosphomannose isomerase [Chloroflexota bacterium]
MRDLDNRAAYSQIDASDYLRFLRQFPEECRRAWEKGLAFPLPESYRGLSRVVIAGMGASAVGGDLAHDLAAQEGGAPIFVHRDYGLPPLLDRRTLFIASSYSGETEETLSAFAEALKTPAKKLALTTGGKLGPMARSHRVPVLDIDYKSPPRAALAHSFIPLLAVLQRLGLVADQSRAVEEMMANLVALSEEVSERVPLSSNPAKELAVALRGRIAVVYGAGFISQVARRWKTQLNENGKSWAFFEVFPELDHNAIEGYHLPDGAPVSVVLLRSPSLPSPILRRYQATAELLSRAGVPHRMVEARGESLLAQMMSLIVIGDYVSYYLAILNGVDPSPVDNVAYLKERLSRG